MSDGFCPECFGDSWYDDYHSCQCNECHLFFSDRELIPLLPVMTEDEWEYLFQQEPITDELAQMDAEC